MTPQRENYLYQVAQDYNVPPFIVFNTAELLGENEDHDGLLAIVEDYEEVSIADTADLDFGEQL